MYKGLFLVLGANFVWGLIFVLPTFLTSFSSIEIALGRYFFFGIISLIFFISFCFKKILGHSIEIWIKALWFALIANILYYIALVLSVKYCGAGMATLITGIAPVSIAFYGNWLKSECSFSKLIFPTILITTGLFTVNLDVFFEKNVIKYSHEYFFGIFCAFASLASWTWYVAANSKFLKSNPTMSYFEWSTTLGVATFVWVAIAMITLAFMSREENYYAKFLTFDPSEVQLFLIITAILGCVCSWFGSFLWNSGCLYLPISLCGQLTIFESIFGIIFVYLIEKRLPTTFECLGITLMLSAIIYSVNMFKKISLNQVVEEKAYIEV